MTDPKLAGLAAWLPATASEDRFFGIDHGTHLSEGVVYDGNAFAAALNDAFAMIARDTGGGIPETLMMSKRAYDIMRLGYDPDGRFARKHRRRQAKRRLKHAGKAWV